MQYYKVGFWFLEVRREQAWILELLACHCHETMTVNGISWGKHAGREASKSKEKTAVHNKLREEEVPTVTEITGLEMGEKSRHGCQTRDT